MNDFTDPQPPQSSLVASICRHGAGDRDCSKNGYRARDNTTEAERNVKVLEAELAALRVATPDSKNFEIEKFEQVGPFMVVQALYPNCSKCSYEGRKIMVFRAVTIADMVHWREIDPHFRPVPKEREALNKKIAPSPLARFAADPGGDGWRWAIAFASMAMK